LLRETLKVKLGNETETEMQVYKAEEVTIVKKKHVHHSNNDNMSVGDEGVLPED